MSLTPEQKAELRLAIEKAEGPGRCSYVNADKTGPQCVIGQLLALRGVDTQTLCTIKGTIGGLLNYKDDLEDPWHTTTGSVEVQAALAGFDVGLLRELQNEWDCSRLSSEDAARQRMLALVEAA